MVIRASRLKGDPLAPGTGHAATLVYILAHPNRDAATANWQAFRDDPEWQSVREKSEANGKLVEKIESAFLVLTDFSPRQP